jgi:hypothetical protein
MRQYYAANPLLTVRIKSRTTSNNTFILLDLRWSSYLDLPQFLLRQEAFPEADQVRVYLCRRRASNNSLFVEFVRLESKIASCNLLTSAEKEKLNAGTHL